ncbi:polysaccharide deacetylase family protein [Bradyrhizobium sp. dw_78]|uniref:polysaccharide deacetylase family protein n=1 Tax=Bradyrhizobium sp. dw_78 TaxID=2719793 RepID=UPI00201C2619|nr:polysaccharide deacetylase family protein [Bradyrhizobium sp. dw_78]
MIRKALVGPRMRQWAVSSAALSLALFTCIAAQAVSAADCPGNPDALGTSRTIVVDPRQHPRIGTMQYAETLPLRDHEVVLSFDDGPLPRNSNQILAILAAQCIKANFFAIGQMARVYPEGIRKLRDAGHTIGTHTQNHPLTMNRMPIERAKAEIDDGIASVKAALGDDADKTLAPFFRIPGLERATAVEDYLASQGIQTWSADFPADDWRHISSQRVYDLAIQRIEAKGKGILLLHDIQARTVAALPRILATLKARGYHIVHVVAATPDRPATPTEPQQWLMHPPLETVAISHWPKVPNFAVADADALAAPALSDFTGKGGELVPLAEPFDRSSHRPLSRATPWPAAPLFTDSAAATLPVPALTVFEIPELPHPTAETVALLAPRSEPTPLPEPKSPPAAANGGNSRRAIRGKSGRGKRLTASQELSSPEPSTQEPSSQAPSSQKPPRGTPATAHARPVRLKHLVQAKRRNV